MYTYSDFDEAFVRERVSPIPRPGRTPHRRFPDRRRVQTLRLMNGLYLQLHAYMLRVAVPYGTLNSAQMTQLAHLADTYDKGYGHFTTRQNIQYNWPNCAMCLTCCRPR